MVTCPRCGRRVDHLHPVPPEVITKDLIESVGSADTASTLEICSECIHQLMEGTLPA